MQLSVVLVEHPGQIHQQVVHFIVGHVRRFSVRILHIKSTDVNIRQQQAHHFNTEAYVAVLWVLRRVHQPMAKSLTTNQIATLLVHMHQKHFCLPMNVLLFTRVQSVVM
jgi:hypothetical protein